MNTNYPNAFAETYFIIKCLSKEEQSKISDNFIHFLSKNKNDEYKISIDPNRNLKNQKLLEETKALLKEIYISYFSSQAEKEQILLIDTYKKEVQENIKKEKYNYEDLFKNKINRKSKEDKKTIISNQSLVLVNKENFIFKIFRKIKQLLNITKK